MEKSRKELPKKSQWRAFWTSFWVSIIFIMFAAGFLYIACSDKSNVREAALSVSVPLYEEGQPHNDSAALSVNILGVKKEVTISQTKAFKDNLSRLYRRFWVLIPPWIRAAGEGIFLLWKYSA